MATEPLIVIGLGGIGTQIAAAVKRHIEADSASRSQVGTTVQILSVDTAMECWSPDLAMGYERLANGFFANASIEGLQTQNFFSKLWPSSYNPALRVQEGGQIRLLGRLCLLETIFNQAGQSLLPQRLNQAMANVSAFWNVNPATGGKRPLNIVLCGSGSGGTCSGIMTDMAFAVRNFAVHSALNPVIMAFVLDSEAVEMNSGANQRPSQLRANYAALLLEMEYWLNASWGDKLNPGSEYDIVYPADGAFTSFNIPGNTTNTQTFLTKSPFDLVFHICGRFSDGSVINDKTYDPLVRLSAEGIAVMARSSASTANFFARNASSDGMDGLGKNGMSKRHGSFGSLTLRVPLELIRAHLSVKRASSIAAAALGAPSQALVEEETVAKSFIASSQLREVGVDELVSALQKNRPQAGVTPPPDIAITLENVEEEEFDKVFQDWMNRCNQWQQQVQKRADFNVKVKLDALLGSGPGSIKQQVEIECKKSLAHGEAFCSALKIQLSLQVTDLGTQSNRGVEQLESMLQQNGSLGDDRLAALLATLKSKFKNFFNRGVPDAKKALAAFLTLRMRETEYKLLQEKAMYLLGELLKEVERWTDAVKWVRDNVVNAVKQYLNDTLGKGMDTAEHGWLPPLPLTLNYGSRPLFMKSALEIHILGSRDIVEDVVGPSDWPNADDPATIGNLRQQFLGDPDGMVSLVVRCKEAQEKAAVGNDPTFWTQLQNSQKNGEFLRNSSRKITSLAGSGYQFAGMSIDKAFDLEAQYVLSLPRERWAGLLTMPHADALLRELNTGGEAAGLRFLKQLRLTSFYNMAVVAAMRDQTAPNLKDPDNRERILSLDASVNTTVSSMIGNQLAGIVVDDRQGVEGEEWRLKMMLTRVEFGTELWYYHSFHRALGSYKNWIADASTRMLPVHTDARYGNTGEYSINLPGDDGAEWIAAFFLLLKVGVIHRTSTEYLAISGFDPNDMDEILEKICVETLDKIKSDNALMKRCVKYKQNIMKKLRVAEAGCTRLDMLLEEAREAAKCEVEATPTYLKGRMRAYLNSFIVYINMVKRQNERYVKQEQIVIANRKFTEADLKDFSLFVAQY